MTASEVAEQIKTIEQALQILKKYRYSEDVEECGILFGKSLDMVILALEQTQWIPCSERLPEERQDVLACFYSGEGNYKILVSRRSDYNYWSGVGRTADMVAWMPLPKPYKGVSKDGRG